MQYVYDFNALDRVPDGPLSASVAPRRMLSGATATTGKSLTTGAVVSGRALHCSIVHNARGTGSKLHTHPNEQFNYVLSGTLIADIDGQVFRVPPGHFIHIPAGMVHSHVSSAEADVIFLAAKDTRHGITGPALDGKYDGPRTLPGFGQHSGNDWAVGPDGLPEAQSPRVSAQRIRYVYDAAGHCGEPDGPCSARVASARGAGASASGLQLSGEKVRVHRVLVDGSEPAIVARANCERFIAVLTGTLRARIRDQDVAVNAQCALHVPAGTTCRISAGAAGPALCVFIEEVQPA